jgi:hypothetical protein
VEDESGPDRNQFKMKYEAWNGEEMIREECKMMNCGGERRRGLNRRPNGRRQVAAATKLEI